MKVLFWTPYPTEGASNRYRVEQYLPGLKLAGIKYNLRPFWNSAAYNLLYKKGHYFKKAYYFILGTLSRIWDTLFIFKYDIVFIHREAYPVGGAFFETILSFFKIPLIFDFDDAIFLPASSLANNFIERFKRPNKIAPIIKKSRYVIVGNSYLSDFALRYNRSVSIISTSIDTDKYYPDEKGHNDKVVIGWTGSITTIDFLNMLKNTFIRLSKRFSYIEFKTVGGNFSIDGLTNIISRLWSLKEEIEDLKTFDIGIMPMPENEWTKGKCGFKAILYMSLGIPCVCSPVGITKEIVSDGINSFLANTEEEWMEKLSLLIENPSLRKKMGLAGRKTIEERFSLKVNMPKFLELLKKIYREEYGGR